MGTIQKHGKKSACFHSNWLRAICAMVTLAASININFPKQSYAAVEAQLSSNKITLGDSVELTLTVEGDFDSDSLQMPEVDGLQVSSSISTSRSYTYSNTRNTNKFRVTKTLILRITPQRMGVFEIPPIELTVDQNKEHTSPFTLTVTKPLSAEQVRASGKLPLMFAERKLSSQDVYITEPIMDTIKLYVKNKWGDLGHFGSENPLFKVFKVEPETSQERFQDHPYWVVTVRRILIPLNVGSLQLGEYGFQAEIVKSGAKNTQTFFGFALPSSMVHKKVSLPPKTITVKAVPDENKPEHFHGFVGDVELHSELSAKEVKVQDPLTLNLVFKGKGWLSSLSLKDPELPDAFKIYPDKPVVDESVSLLGIGGSKTFSYALVPLKEGVYDLGVFEWSYFDIETRSYRRLATQLGEVRVTANTALKTTASNPSDTDNTGSNPEVLQPVAEDSPNDMADPWRSSVMLPPLQVWLHSVLPPSLILLLLWTLLICLSVYRLLKWHRKLSTALSPHQKLAAVKKKVSSAIHNHDHQAIFDALAWYVSPEAGAAVAAYDIASKLQDETVFKEDYHILKELCAAIENQRFQLDKNPQIFGEKYWRRWQTVIGKWHSHS
ncbi:MAG: BatD family protein [Proteobacteria bacterium]|nr:BatD family protein [Pseudomonadota bacterium]